MADFTSAANGNYKDGATWGNTSPGTEGTDYPSATDNATIVHTVALTADQGVVNLTIGASGILNTANYALTLSGVYDQSSTSSRCNAGTATITVNGNGTFTADGTLDSTQYNSATLVLNGTNTLTYNNLSNNINGFNNVTVGQNGNTTTINATSGLGVQSVLTIGSGILTRNNGAQLMLRGSNPLSVDAGSRISGFILYFIPTVAGVQTIPELVNGYDSSINVHKDSILTQTGNIVLNSSNYLNVTGGSVASFAATWKTDGYNLTVGGNLTIGVGSDTGLKKLDATGSGGRTSTITVGGNWLNKGNGTVPSQFIADDSTVIFNKATGTQTLTSGATNSPFYNLTHSGAGTLQLLDNCWVKALWLNSAGTLDSNNKTLSNNYLASF